MRKKNYIEDFFNGHTKLPEFDQLKASKARELQNELLKPKGSLGKLEEYAIWMAGWQKKINPSIENAHCLIFAGNHGVARKGVSAFPSEVTEQMVENFKKGGAAINQLCELAGLKLNVIPLDLDEPTKDFSENFAMDIEEVMSAMQTGFDAVSSNCDLLVLGEMGISNTTSASALSCALFNEKVESMTGTGTGLNNKQLENKMSVIKSALKLHGTKFTSTIKILSCFGGREISAIAGSIIAARLKSIPVLLDGFICTAAASTLTLFDENFLDHCQISHLSTEPGHLKILSYLKKDPILDLNLRLGEGSGAAIASLILKSAIVTHNGMSTFSDAHVTNKKVS